MFDSLMKSGIANPMPMYGAADAAPFLSKVRKEESMNDFTWSGKLTSLYEREN